MARVISKTEDFYSAVKRSDGFKRLRHGEELLLPTVAVSSNFVSEGENILSSMGMLRSRLNNIRGKYMEYHAQGMADSERDIIDQDVGRALKTIAERIDVLKNTEHGRETMRAHRLGIVVSLVEELQEVETLARELRGSRIRKALKTKSKGNELPQAPMKFQDLPSAPPASAVANDLPADMLQALEQESDTLHTDLVQRLDKVQAAEKQMMEIAALNHMLASTVLEQSKDIEQLYMTAVKTVKDTERGNEHLRALTRKGMGIQLKIALFLILAALSLVVLEVFL